MLPPSAQALVPTRRLHKNTIRIRCHACSLTPSLAPHCVQVLRNKKGVKWQDARWQQAYTDSPLTGEWCTRPNVRGQARSAIYCVSPPPRVPVPSMCPATTLFTSSHSYLPLLPHHAPALARPRLLACCLAFRLVAPL